MTIGMEFTFSVSQLSPASSIFCAPAVHFHILVHSKLSNFNELKKNTVCCICWQLNWHTAESPSTLLLTCGSQWTLQGVLLICTSNELYAQPQWSCDTQVPAHRTGVCLSVQSTCLSVCPCRLRGTCPWFRQRTWWHQSRPCWPRTSLPSPNCDHHPTALSSRTDVVWTTCVCTCMHVFCVPTSACIHTIQRVLCVLSCSLFSIRHWMWNACTRPQAYVYLRTQMQVLCFINNKKNQANSLIVQKTTLKTGTRLCPAASCMLRAV